MTDDKPSPIGAERAARWVALGAAVVGLVGFAVTAGATVHPLVGWGAVVLVAGAVAWRLWYQEFDRRGLEHEAAAHRKRSAPEPYRGPAPDGAALSVPDAYRP